jgi:hypothetical protein
MVACDLHERSMLLKLDFGRARRDGGGSRR